MQDHDWMVFDSAKPPDFKPFAETLGAVVTFGSIMVDPYHINENDPDSILSLVDIYNQPVVNHSSSWATMKVCLDRPTSFLVPPKSSFLYSKFEVSFDAFDTLARTASSPGFDFILLDPPWENRSVKRGRRRHLTDSYKSLKQEALYSLDFRPMSVGGLLRQYGIVGIWITNKAQIKNFVVNKLFKSWGLTLVAEWIWAKITVEGEPIFSLKSNFRKPYEILLLAREDPAQSLDTPLHNKVIFAVPEVHSRKPCIKNLIEPYLRTEECSLQQTDKGPRVCEVFARNLTEGWFSWGDEVLKGNWDGCWTSDHTLSMPTVADCDSDVSMS